MALQDVAAIQDWTSTKFGELTSLRYDRLMEAALADLLAEPTRLGVRHHPAMPQGVFVYHLRFSRRKPTREVVAKPRHFFVFRVDEDILTVLRVLHDSMDLAAHVESPAP
ncbi:MAG: type II toxin-antitoxin system RelE/ParE family toxin [Polaromonas sp.]